jgi:hypothetical protein
VTRYDPDTFRAEFDRLWPAYDKLDLYDAPPAAENEPVSTGKAKVSPALIRMDVLALQDPRTRWDGKPSSPRWLPRACAAWANRLADHLGLPRHQHTGTAPATIITAWWAELLKAPWVEEMAEEVHGLLRQLDRANGDQEPRTPRALGDDPTRGAGRLSVADTAHLLGVKPGTVRQLVARGKIARNPDGTIDARTVHARLSPVLTDS